MPVGVIQKPGVARFSLERTLALPVLPRFRPSASSRFTVATRLGAQRAVGQRCGHGVNSPTVPCANNAAMPSALAGTTPRSVISALTSRAGVTSKAGLTAPRSVGHHLHFHGRAVAGAAAEVRHLACVAFFDRNLGQAVGDRTVERGQRHRHIERHAVVVRGERLQVGADLVRHVAARADAVAADDHGVHMAALHQVAAGVVGNHAVRHALFAQLEGGQARALVARPGLIHPDVDGQTLCVRQVDRRQRGAPVDGGEPARVAMRQHVEHLPWLARGEGLQQCQAIAGDGLVAGDVVFGEPARRRPTPPPHVRAWPVHADGRACGRQPRPG